MRFVPIKCPKKHLIFIMQHFYSLRMTKIICELVNIIQQKNCNLFPYFQSINKNIDLIAYITTFASY